MSTLVEKKKSDYTEGSIIQSILKMGVPSMIGFLASHIYYMVDMYWLSHLPEGEMAVAAVTIYSNISYGEKNYEAAETAIKETFLMKWLIGMMLGLIGYLFIEKLVFIGGARGETLTLGIEYGRVIFLGMGFSYATYSVYTAMRGIANPNMAMSIMLGSTVLNHFRLSRISQTGCGRCRGCIRDIIYSYLSHRDSDFIYRGYKRQITSDR